jgi:hypothetical protein
MDFRNEMRFLGESFGELTREITLQEWREIRKPEYWKADKYKTDIEKLEHKIKIISEWKKKNRK